MTVLLWCACSEAGVGVMNLPMGYPGSNGLKSSSVSTPAIALSPAESSSK